MGSLRAVKIFRRPVLRSLKNFFCKSESCHGSLCLSKECKGQSGRAPPFSNFVFYFLSLKIELAEIGQSYKKLSKFTEFVEIARSY